MLPRAITPLMVVSLLYVYYIMISLISTIDLYVHSICKVEVGFFFQPLQLKFCHVNKCSCIFIILFIENVCLCFIMRIYHHYVFLMSISVIDCIMYFYYTVYWKCLTFWCSISFINCFTTRRYRHYVFLIFNTSI